MKAPDGRVFIADTGNNRIRVVATNGTITTFAGGGANTACSYTGTATGLSLNAPQGVAVDGSGNVYIADTGNNCIRRIDPSGAVTRVAGGGGATTCGSGNVTASRSRCPAPPASQSPPTAT